MLNIIMNWVTLHKKYKGKWVAFKNDNETVVANGKTAAQTLQLALKKGYIDPILYRVPSKVVAFVGRQ